MNNNKRSPNEIHHKASTLSHWLPDPLKHKVSAAYFHHWSVS